MGHPRAKWLRYSSEFPAAEQSRTRFATLIPGVYLLLCGFATAQNDARELVSTVVQNELAAQKSEAFWMYRDSKMKKGRVEVQRVLETPQCHMTWPLVVDGKAPSSQAKAHAQKELEQLVTDPQARAKNLKEIDEDSSKANSLMKLLPDAFLFKSEGRQKDILKIRFRPNPSYQSKSNESKVFHSMAGILLINTKEKRLAKMTGQLVDDVDFGFGILGKLHKGGTFTVVQKEVAPGDWELIMLDVHISGQALFFHQIGDQQHEVMTSFTRVPANLDLEKAASLVQSGTP